MKYKLLESFLPLLDRYEQQVDEQQHGVDDFLRWVQQRNLQHSQDKKTKSVPLKSNPPVGTTQAQISQLIARMTKYSKFYLKKGFKGLPLRTPDDFGYLATLVTFGPMTKTQLIQRNVSEVPSGMEVIKRLQREALIHSFEDPDDRRATRVDVTPEGRNVFRQVIPRMQQIGSLITGSLDESETFYLLTLLNKLHFFHQPIFEQEKRSSLDDIVNEYRT